MRQAKLYRYQLPMDSGVIIRQQRLNQRQGLIVELQQDQRRVYGEIAPLPQFSQETVEQAEQQVVPILQAWLQTGLWPQWQSLYPSVAFGLSCANYELEQQLPVDGQYLSAPLCSGDPDELLPLFEGMVGEKVAKVKVGLYEPIRDGMLMNLFLESIEQLQLRLDANRSWSLDKALKFAGYIEPHLRSRISFIEEPCQTEQQSVEFAAQTGIAIAWDETLQQAVKQPHFHLASLAHSHVSAIVIKPTLIGSVEFCIELIQQAHQLGLKAVISSSLESSLGLTQLARLAAWQTPNQLPGLDTLQLFAAQLHTPWPDSDLELHSLAQQSLIWSAEQA